MFRLRWLQWAVLLGTHSAKEVFARQWINMPSLARDAADLNGKTTGSTSLAQVQGIDDDAGNTTICNLACCSIGYGTRIKEPLYRGFRGYMDVGLYKGEKNAWFHYWMPHTFAEWVYAEGIDPLDAFNKAQLQVKHAWYNFDGSGRVRDRQQLYRSKRICRTMDALIAKEYLLTEGTKREFNLPPESEAHYQHEHLPVPDEFVNIQRQNPFWDARDNTKAKHWHPTGTSQTKATSRTKIPSTCASSKHHWKTGRENEEIFMYLQRIIAGSIGVGTTIAKEALKEGETQISKLVVLNIGAEDGVMDDPVSKLSMQTPYVLAVEMNPPSCVAYRKNIPHATLLCEPLQLDTAAELLKTSFLKIGVGTAKEWDDIEDLSVGSKKPHEFVFKLDIDSFECDLIETLFSDETFPLPTIVAWEVNTAIPPPFEYFSRYDPTGKMNFDITAIANPKFVNETVVAEAPVVGCSLMAQVNLLWKYGFVLTHFNIGDAVYRRVVNIDRKTKEITGLFRPLLLEKEGLQILDPFSIFAIFPLGAQGVHADQLRRVTWAPADALPTTVSRWMSNWIADWLDWAVEKNGMEKGSKRFLFDLMLNGTRVRKPRKVDDAEKASF